MLSSAAAAAAPGSALAGNEAGRLGDEFRMPLGLWRPPRGCPDKGSGRFGSAVDSDSTRVPPGPLNLARFCGGDATEIGADDSESMGDIEFSVLEPRLPLVLFESFPPLGWPVPGPFCVDSDFAALRPGFSEGFAGFTGAATLGCEWPIWSAPPLVEFNFRI